MTDKLRRVVNPKHIQRQEQEEPQEGLRDALAEETAKLEEKLGKKRETPVTLREKSE